MTKQEAVIILKCIKAENLNLDNVYIKDRYDALTIAIEMLEKKLTEPWCEGCKEHDKEHHCCHRYSNVIRQTLNDNINAVLEDIKEELNDPYRPINSEETTMAYVRGLNDGLAVARSIIDEHISGKEEE